MSWLYQRQYYLVPRQQTVRHSDGRKVVTTRFGPRDWTRTTTHADGTKSITRSTSHGPMTTIMAIAMLLVAPAAFLGAYSIPIYVGAALLLVVLLAASANPRTPVPSFKPSPRPIHALAASGAPGNSISNESTKYPTAADREDWPQDGRERPLDPKAVPSNSPTAINVGEIWSRLRQHEGEVFHQIRGKAFTYSLTVNGLIPSTTDWLIPKDHFARALELVPLRNTVPVQHLYGPSYIYALLMDSRIRGIDW